MIDDAMVSETGDLVVETVRQVMQGLIRGDTALRVDTLARLDRRDVQPHLLVTGKMGAKLAFAVDLSESKEFLFGLFGDERKRPVADIRLHFELRPALSLPRLAIDPGTLRVLPPPFFRRPGLGGPLELAISGGHTVTVEQDHDGLRIEVDDHGPVGTRGVLPLWFVVALLDTLAAWSKQGPSGEPLPLALESGTRLDKLMASIYAGYAGIADVVTGEPDTETARAARRRLFQTYPGLAGGYRLSKLGARVLVQLDRDGDLVSDPDDPEWQQYDLEARMVAGAGPPAIHLSFRLPDVLTEGRFHRAFLESIRQDDNVERLRAAGGGFSRDVFREFMLSPGLNARALFVRIRHDDLDLVLLRGTLNGDSLGLLYLVQFAVAPFPNVRVEAIESVQLIGLLRGAGEWQGEVSDDAVRGYCRRLFTVFVGWHQRMRAG